MIPSEYMDLLNEEEPPRLFFCQEDEDAELIGH